MVASDRKLRPMQVRRTGRPRRNDGDLSDMPDAVPERAMAPDWVGPTEGNGSDAPRADLHVALIAPDKQEADRLRKLQFRVVKPPLWKGGRIWLHIVTPSKLGIDLSVAQALVDLGFVDAKDVEIAAPEDVTLGYPSGLTENQR